MNVSSLSVSYRQGSGWRRVVDEVSFAVKRGEVFGLVGESGCGKSTVAAQLLGVRHPAMRVDGGRVSFEDRNLLDLSRRELDAVRGAKVSFVPQNPTTALNPGMRVGAQVDEILLVHGLGDASARRKRILELFDLVGLPAQPPFARRFPHQLSGGQQQRVCIAIALACDPAFVVLDEPTTGLDVTTQAQIVALLVSLRAGLSTAMLYVTHDLGLLSQIADRVGVMYAGRMVEVAPTADLFADPKHPYTRGLIGSIPWIEGWGIEGRAGPPARPLKGFLQREVLPPGCPFSPRCDHAEAACAAQVQVLAPADAPGREVACRRWREIVPPAGDDTRPGPQAAPEGRELLSLRNVRISYGRGAKSFTAVPDISLGLREGETLALMGESGSGKSTIARAIAGLVPPAEGEIALLGKPLAPGVEDRAPEERRLIQFIFQNPDASLNPRARVAKSLARPIRFFFGGKARDVAARATEALAHVRLAEAYAARFPDELSGGERQRVAIARGLVAEPKLLLCDEILSALDVSVQANVLALLQRLKAEHDVAMLFISHDLAVVRALADSIAVLFRGEIMELGPREKVFAPPFHPYTHSLLEAVPEPLKPLRAPPRRREAQALQGKACAYAGRCPWQIGAVCEEEAPPWRTTPDGLGIRCHHPLDELTRRATWPGRAETATGEKVSA